MSKKKAYPPVIFVAGSEGYYCRKLISQIREDLSSRDWTVKYLGGTERDGLLAVVSGSMGFLFDTETLVIISSQVNKVDPSVIEAHLKDPNPSVVILLYHEGKPKRGGVFAKWSRKVPKNKRFRFDVPSIFKKVSSIAIAVSGCGSTTSESSPP